MSILSQNPLRRATSESRKLHEMPESKEVSEKDFKDLLRAEQISEETRNKNFFELLTSEEEEETENKEGILAAAALDLKSFPTYLAGLDSVSISEVTACKTAQLSAEIEFLFEKMASCMIVMHSSQESETTLILEGPQFTSSSLFGTQITIREFSTAPKIFNVEILSNAHAAAIIETGKNGLLSHFEKGNFNFSVHRLDTRIRYDEQLPLLHRKEEKDQEQKEGRGDQQP